MFVRALLPIFLLLAACEKTDHEHIDKWMKTEKGPAKLTKALKDDSIDADLSAHAAANMIKKGMDPEVRDAFAQMAKPRAAEVAGKLAPRLWDIARVEGEMTIPGPLQVQAKDALVQIRKYADDAAREQIDKYLVDWYGAPSYERRATMGSTQGASVMRLVGEPGGKRLIGVLNGVLAAPGQEKTKIRIHDELLLGLAASGSPEAVKYILDVARMDRGDATLSNRAMSALYKGYIDSQKLFDPAPKEALVPHVGALASIAQDDSLSGQANNDAVALIRTAGPPHCLRPLVDMLGHPHKDPAFRYSIAQAALRCGGGESVKEVISALPDGPYALRAVQTALAGEIADLAPRDKVLAALRDLLGDRKLIARWVAIEALAAMKSVEDAPKIAALGGSSEKLVGYYEADEKEGTPEPTLGHRAKELAAQLGKGPQ